MPIERLQVVIEAARDGQAQLSLLPGQVPHASWRPRQGHLPLQLSQCVQMIGQGTSNVHGKYELGHADGQWVVKRARGQRWVEDVGG
jgi:hypothetical protein